MIGPIREKNSGALRCEHWPFLLLFAMASCFALPVRAEDGAKAFAILNARCAECHSPAEPKHGLVLTDPAGIVRGAKKGPVVRPGNPEASTLWQKVSADEMPPEKPLPAEEKETLREWIAGGAPGLPEPAGGVSRPDPATHWAFRAPVRQDPPKVREGSRVRNDIDRFVEHELEKQGLGIGTETDRGTLIRRVAFDLTGLPPTPSEISEFVNDSAPDAYERMMERYLASPRYGERWGRHWLDAAGYADSNGYFNADSDRPLAYRYRDYVIRAHSDDKPFDQFIREQIAGDELAGYKPGGDVTPEMAELLTATHFLRNAPDGTGESDGNDLERQTDRYSVIEGTLEVTCSALLGLTIKCAKCHDHKFDPISQREYFQMQAIFSAAYTPDPKRWMKPNERVVAIARHAEVEAWEKRTKELDEQSKPLKKHDEALTALMRKELGGRRIAKLEEPLRSQLTAARSVPESERTEEQRRLVEQNEKLFKGTEKEIADEYRFYAALHGRIRAKLDEIEKERPAPLNKVSALFEDRADPPPHHLLRRGQIADPGPEVEQGVPKVLCTATNPYKVAPRGEGETSSGRRRAFANWLTSPENPLLARVTVNRVWQYHFGRPLVATPANFGLSGAPPTHPELLDYLAVEFVRNGWSLKALHRTIMLSGTYRQTSATTAEAMAADPENRLFHAYPLHRLEAEAIRDAMLATSGELDGAMFGPYVPVSRDKAGQVIIAEDAPGAHRRSIYLQQRRTQIPALLDLFDCPSMVSNAARRSNSTIPLQSLALLNSEFVMSRSLAFARRLEKAVGNPISVRIDLAYELALGRKPDPAEKAMSEEFLNRQVREYGGREDAERLALRDFCQMLFASNAFLYIE